MHVFTASLVIVGLEMESGRGTSHLVLANLSPVSLDSPPDVLLITTISCGPVGSGHCVRAFTVGRISYNKFIQNFLKVNPKHDFGQSLTYTTV